MTKWWVMVFAGVLVLFGAASYAGDLRLIQTPDGTCGVYDEWPVDYAVQLVWTGVCSGGLAEGPGIAVIYDDTRDLQFGFTGVMVQGRMTGTGWAEWSSGAHGKFEFADGKFNGPAALSDRAGSLTLTAYSDNIRQDPALDRVVQKNDPEYDALIETVRAVDVAGLAPGCGKAVHKARARVSLLTAGVTPGLDQTGLGLTVSRALGSCLRKENDPLWPEAFVALRTVAEVGDLGAIMRLANLLAQPDQTAEERREAFDWYLKAAQQGDPEAQNSVGFWLDNGRNGVAEDKAAAIGWYRKAAEQGLDVAQFNLAASLDDDSRSEAERREAFDWYLKAAEGGNKFAVESVQRVCDVGHDTPDSYKNIPARVFYGDKRVDKAIAILRTLTSRQDELIAAHAWRALAYCLDPNSGGPNGFSGAASDAMAAAMDTAKRIATEDGAEAEAALVLLGQIKARDYYLFAEALDFYAQAWRRNDAAAAYDTMEEIIKVVLPQAANSLDGILTDAAKMRGAEQDIAFLLKIADRTISRFPDPACRDIVGVKAAVDYIADDIEINLPRQVSVAFDACRGEFVGEALAASLERKKLFFALSGLTNTLGAHSVDGFGAGVPDCMTCVLRLD